MTKKNKKPIDYPILLTIIILVAFGTIMVFSASFYYAQLRWGDKYYFFRRQCVWAVVGFIAMAFTANFSYWKLQKFSRLLMIITIVLLIAVLVVGVERNNAKRWLSIGGLSVQPAEIAKFSLILYLAHSMSLRRDKIKYFFKGVVPYLLITGILFGLIMLQPNFSTAGSLVLLSIVMLFVAGARLWHLGFLAVCGASAAAALVMAAKYRLERWMAFLDPWKDPIETGYQMIQSLYSLGAGGLFGMGLGESRQKYLYIPYPETDFIYAIIGEELGFIGSAILILLFVILIWRGLKIAITAPDLFGCLLATGIIGMIAIQTTINIAVVTASMPPTGLPLPFVSFGGSSLAISMASIGVLLNISRYAKTG
ncbi:MAG: stage V sporulation protein E [Clostridiales bacterium]|nr:stage V sporulation protein E [Clostridiales bacterium]